MCLADMGQHAPVDTGFYRLRLLLVTPKLDPVGMKAVTEKEQVAGVTLAMPRSARKHAS